MTQNLLKWGAALLICCAAFTACDDDTNDGGGKLPSKQTVAAFEAQFPDATNVQWSKKKGYDVATFGLATRATPAKRNSAWYPEGSTACSYTKLEITWAELQQQAPAVAQAWTASAYKTQGYLLDDIDVKTFADAEAVYKLEAELGETERELVYKADGTLLSDRLDIDDEDENEEDDPSPQAILDFIAQNLPDAVIVDTDTEREGGNLYYEVEIRVGNQEKELIFNGKQEFLHILVELDDDNYQSALPAAVYTKFLQLAADTETWDDVSIREDITGKAIGYVLVVEEEETDRETTYVVDAQGNLLG